MREAGLVRLQAQKNDRKQQAVGVSVQLLQCLVVGWLLPEQQVRKAGLISLQAIKTGSGCVSLIVTVCCGWLLPEQHVREAGLTRLQAQLQRHEAVGMSVLPST
jgi:hypothetical protein